MGMRGGGKWGEVGSMGREGRYIYIYIQGAVGSRKFQIFFRIFRKLCARHIYSARHRQDEKKQREHNNSRVFVNVFAHPLTTYGV